jgi:hypothetical protein
MLEPPPAGLNTHSTSNFEPQTAPPAHLPSPPRAKFSEHRVRNSPSIVRASAVPFLRVQPPRAEGSTKTVYKNRHERRELLALLSWASPLRSIAVRQGLDATRYPHGSTNRQDHGSRLAARRPGRLMPQASRGVDPGGSVRSRRSARLSMLSACGDGGEAWAP